jgi:hypothetical protein
MNTINAHPEINYEQHQLEMLLWHAKIHEKNGQKQEASNIREWVATFAAHRGGTELGRFNVTL